MKKILYFFTILFAALFALFLILEATVSRPIFLSLTVTFGVTFYHLAMRLFVGWLVNKIYYERIDYTKKQFQPKKFEKKLYKTLRVKSWKKHMPTYNPSSFDPKVCTPRRILKNSCIAEVGHEAIMLLSFLPILMIIPFGEPLVFVLTSIAAALMDSVFVIIQRYNRPRFLRIIKRYEQTHKTEEQK